MARFSRKFPAVAGVWIIACMFAGGCSGGARQGAKMDGDASGPDPITGELLRNGDFERGRAGFESDYTAGTIMQAQAYDILRDPHAVHDEATSLSDHTTGKGLMLAVNGGDAPDRAVWSRTVRVRPGTGYIFSLWLASWYPSAPAQLDIRINGQSIGRITAPALGGTWKEFRGTWKSGGTEKARVEIFDLNTAISGNDFAIDDISMTAAPM